MIVSAVAAMLAMAKLVGIVATALGFVPFISWLFLFEQAAYMIVLAFISHWCWRKSRQPPPAARPPTDHAPY